jgi:hypothetical protein
MIKIGDKAKLTKVSDDYFNGNHPNHINEGYIVKGKLMSLPKIGERFYFGKRFFSTSIVKEELNEEGIFKTTYSTYKLEKIK